MKEVAHLNHGGVGARAEAFDFEQRKQAVLGRAAVLDVELVHDGFLDVFRAAHHARRSAAQLDEVLAALFPVEHGVKGSHFVDAHRRNAHDFGHLKKREKKQKAARG